MEDPHFRGAFLSSEDHINYLNIENYGRFYYRRSREVVYYYYLCIYMHTPTPLRDEIDQNIINVAAFGLIQHWVSSYTKGSYIGEHNRNTNTDNKPIDNSHLLGAYQIYFAGILIASLVFLTKLVWMKIKVYFKMMKLNK